MKPKNRTAKWQVVCLASMAGLLWATTPTAGAQATDDQNFKERKLESIVVDGKTFSNVRVVQQSATDVMFRHDGGITGFKVQYLDNPTLRRLGYEIVPPPANTAEIAAQRLGSLPDLLPSGNVRWGLILLLTGLVALIAGTWLYTGYVFRLICLNAGTRPGIAVWFPFFQAFPLMRAARMSWAWVVAVSSLTVLLTYAGFRAPEHLPVLGAILATAFAGLAIVWSVRICHACGRSTLFAVLLLLPGLNYLALLHLATSR